MSRTTSIHIRVSICFLIGAGLIAANTAFAQSQIVDQIRSKLDDVARGMNYVGQKAGGLVGQGLGLVEERKTPCNDEKPFSETYPVGPTPTISVSNQFGEIRVATWDERVVQVNAQIAVGAERTEVTQEILKAISIQCTPTEELVEVKTVFPETRPEWGYVAMSVNYTITIPKTASLITSNFFGDTTVQGTGGQLAVEAQYGAVDISNATGSVKVRTHGEFPVRARGLTAGGVFQLHNAQAEFSEIGGELEVNNFRGSIALNALAEDAFVDVTSEGGPVHLILPSEAKPDLTATVLYGTLTADMPLSKVTQANKIVARGPNPASKQRILLNVSFGDVLIEGKNKEGQPVAGPSESAKPFDEPPWNHTEPVPEGATLRIETKAPGDVRLEGIDEKELRITATRTVWVPQAAQAPAALGALQIEPAKTEDGKRFTVSTSVTGDMKQLGCSAYRVNLTIQCPRSLPVEIVALDGQTTVAGLGGTISVQQAAGEIVADHLMGPITIDNKNGPVSVTECSAPVDVTAQFGPVTLSRNYDKIKVQCSQGRVAVESAQKAVFVRCNGGDVRILALASEGVGGPYDVLVENGNLSMVLSPEADAALSLKCTGGTIKSSAIQLTDGSTMNDQVEYSARLKNGANAIRLESRAGNIYLD